MKNPGRFPVLRKTGRKSRENQGKWGFSRKIYLTRFPFDANIIEQLNLFLLNRGAPFISTASEAANRGRRGKGKSAEGSGCCKPLPGRMTNSPAIVIVLHDGELFARGLLTGRVNTPYYIAWMTG